MTARRTTALAVAVTGLCLAVPAATAAGPAVSEPASPEPAGTRATTAEPTKTPSPEPPTPQSPTPQSPAAASMAPTTQPVPVPSTVTAPPMPPSAGASPALCPSTASVTPSSSPTAAQPPATREPAPSSPSVTPPGDTRPNGVTEEDAPEVRDAVAALQAAERALAAARERAGAAEREHRAALHADAMAAAELATVRLTEQRLQQQITAIDQELAKHRLTLGSMAAHAYRMGGVGDWSVLLLGAESPQDFLNRLAYVDAIVQGGNASIRELTRIEADLKAKQRQVTGLRERREELRAQTAANLKRKAAAQQAARAAQAEIARLVQQRQAALAALGAARQVDLSRYQVRQVESGRIGQLILPLQQRNQDSGIRPAATGSLLRPVVGPVTSPYGIRLHPILGYRKLHTGVDFGPGDHAIRAADNGVVIMKAYNTAYGNLTVIDHGSLDGRLVATLYAHQSTFQVEVGQRVRKGQLIGLIGSTGYSTGPHLHFEVRVNGVPVDPARWVPGLR